MKLIKINPKLPFVWAKMLHVIYKQQVMLCAKHAGDLKTHKAALTKERTWKIDALETLKTENGLRPDIVGIVDMACTYHQAAEDLMQSESTRRTYLWPSYIDTTTALKKLVADAHEKHKQNKLRHDPQEFERWAGEKRPGENPLEFKSETLGNLTPGDYTRCWSVPASQFVIIV